MNKFTAEQAFEASKSGDPILMTSKAAEKLCSDHGAEYSDYINDTLNTQNDIGLSRGIIDAADILGWLGY